MEQIACMDAISMPADAIPKRSGRKFTAGKRSLTQSTACTEDDMSPRMTPLATNSTVAPSDMTDSPFTGSVGGSPVQHRTLSRLKTQPAITEEAEPAQSELPPGLEEFSPAWAEQDEATSPQEILVSAGSDLHGTGHCRPCAWLYKPDGCKNGAECHYCHSCPEGEIKTRKKSKVEAMRSRKDSNAESISSQEPLQLQMDEPLYVSAIVDTQSACEEQDRLILTPPPGLMLPVEGEEVEVDLKLLANSEQWLGVSAVPEAKERDASSESPRASSGSEDPTTSDEAAPLPSLGSAMHATGTCRPCAWFYKASGCSNGEDCRHCHACPEGAIRDRRKAKVAQLRTEVTQQQEVSMQQSLWAVQQHQEAMIFASLQVQAMWGAAAAEASAAFGALVAQPAPIEPLSSPEPISSPEPASPMSVRLPAGTLSDTPSLSPSPSPVSGGPLPSKGSALHALGQCRPCAWLWKPSGCKNGEDCEHCHACPQGELKERKKIKAGKRPDVVAAGSARLLGTPLREPAIIERLPRPVKIDSAFLC